MSTTPQQPLLSRGGFSTWLVFDDTIPFTRPTYLTDVQCGFCRGHMARVQSWFPGTFDAVDFRQAPLAELGLTQEEADAAGHLVVPVGDGPEVLAPRVAPRTSMSAARRECVLRC